MRFIRGLMKGILLLVVALMIVSALFGDTVWFRSLTGEKFFEEQELRVEARLLPNGNMNVRETRQIKFHGEFSRYRRQIPHKGFSEMRIVGVSEPSVEYQRIQSTSSRPAGKYTFTRGRESGNDVYNIEFYFLAKDETRTFTFEYQIIDAVKVHTDTAEFYWQFIGRNRTVEIGRMSVRLDLPSGAGAEEVKLWGHGPLRGEVRKLSPNQLFWQTTDLPKNRFLEGRAVFPARLVPQARILTGRQALATILTEEQRWADERAAEQRRAVYVLAASFIFGILGLYFVWWLFNRFGRKYRSPIEYDYYRELPGPYSPAEAGCLVEKGSVKPQAISATLMDLARRGYIRLEPTTTPQTEDILVRQLRPADGSLRPHERYLLDFFFTQVGQMQPAVWFSSLKAFRKADPQAMAEFVRSFRDEVTDSVNTMAYFERSRTGKWIATTGFLLCLFLGLGFYSTNEFPPMIAALSVAGAFLVSGSQSRTFTPQGQVQYDQWQAFRRFLKDFSNLDRAQLPQLILWEHYLVYAVVLGVAAEVIRQLPIVYPQLSQPDNRFGYYWGGMYHTSYASDGGTFSSFAGLASVSDMMSSLDDTWSHAFSAVSSSGDGSFFGGDSGGGGDGGGFSGGGGDGGGGGGGDAD